MRKFDVLRSITGVKEFSNLVFNLAREVDTPEALGENLSRKLTDDELQVIITAAQSGNYPLSLDGMQ